MISSTSTSSGIVAGVAALILSRFPHLTVAQVTLALTGGTTGGTTTDRADAPGTGHGTVDAARAVRGGGRPSPRRPSQAWPAQSLGPPAYTRAAADHHGG